MIFHLDFRPIFPPGDFIHRIPFSVTFVGKRHATSLNCNTVHFLQ